jgi:hypothetical protein
VTDFHGYTVFEMKTNSRDEISDTSTTGLSIFDPGLGKRSVNIKTEVPSLAIPFVWTCRNKAEVAALKAWFVALRGRLTPFWMPSGRRDLLLAEVSSTESTTFILKPCGYVKYGWPSRSRRNVAFRLPGGSFVYRQIVSVEDHVSTERIIVDPAIEESLPAGSWISYLHLCRLASDELKITWHNDSVAEASFKILERPQEVPA